jgi:hypothetical protein
MNCKTPYEPLPLRMKMRSTYELIKDEFVCERRGTVMVKGKREMEVWHILSEKIKA